VFGGHETSAPLYRRFSGMLKAYNKNLPKSFEVGNAHLGTFNADDVLKIKQFINAGMIKL
jgi:hypothetical protein